MGKNEKLKNIVADTGKKAKGLMEHVVRTVDQDDNGKFDLKDVAIMGAAMGHAVKKETQSIKTGVEDKKLAMDRKLLQPIFLEDLSSANFYMPKFIHLTERDKRHRESEACQNSIGYHSNQKGLQVVHIFKDSVDAFGINLLLDEDADFFYVDPSDRNSYIPLEEYFGYLKVARINELQTIAQDLGAKHFRIVYKEEKISFSEKKVKANAEAKANGTFKANGEHAASESKYFKVEIQSEMSFAGHAPTKPELKYMANDSSIQSLVKMRMNPDSPLLHQTYLLEMNNSSGLKESDAEKIDTFLKGVKASCNASMASEAKNEARRYLEYEIDF